MATHSSTLALKIPWTEEPGRLQSTASQRVGPESDTTERLHFHFNQGLVAHFILVKIGNDLSVYQ